MMSHKAYRNTSPLGVILLGKAMQERSNSTSLSPQEAKEAMAIAEEAYYLGRDEVEELSTSLNEQLVMDLAAPIEISAQQTAVLRMASHTVARRGAEVIERISVQLTSLEYSNPLKLSTMVIQHLRNRESNRIHRILEATRRFGRQLLEVS
jgi:uncharacterized protein (UPF0216 family)